MSLTEVFVLAGILVNVGMYLQTSRSNTKAIDSLALDLKEHKEDIWPKVNDAREQISKIKGHLGINGEFARGKSHHV